MARRSRHRAPITHDAIDKALRRFKLSGRPIRKLPENFKVQVEAARFEQQIGNYQGLMEWQ